MNPAAALLVLLIANPPPITPRLFLPAVATVPADCHTATIYAGSVCVSWGRLSVAVQVAAASYPAMPIATTITHVVDREEIYWRAANGCAVGFVVRVTGTQPGLTCPINEVLDGPGLAVWQLLNGPVA